MRHQQAIPKTRLMQWCWDVLHGSCCRADATSSPIEQAPQRFDVIAGTVEVIGHVSTTCAEPGVQTKRDDRESLQASSRLTTVGAESWQTRVTDLDLPRAGQIEAIASCRINLCFLDACALNFGKVMVMARASGCT